MNTLDVIILIVLAGGLIRGFSTGIIRQVAGVAGLITAIVLSVRLMDPAGGLLMDHLGVSSRFAPVAGFVAVFVIVQIVVFALIRMVEAVVGALKLSPVNRLLGGAVGALKAAVVLSVAFLLLGYLDVPEESTRLQSALYNPIASVLPETWALVSGHVPEIKQLSQDLGDRVEQTVMEGR